MINLHLKSKNPRSSVGDPNVQRRAQIDYLAEVIKDLQGKFYGRVIISGDFNADLSGIGDPGGREEFQRLWESGLINPIDDLAESELYTHTFRNNGNSTLQQLDAVLFSLGF